MIYDQLTAPQLQAIDRNKCLAVVPIAAVEQHGPHMPTGTDTILCDAITLALERGLPDQILKLPTMWLGASAHHLPLGSTLDAGMNTYQQLLHDLGRSLLADGFTRVWFINGHGGNVDPMKVALRELQTLFSGVVLAGGSYWAGVDDLVQRVVDGDAKYLGHACEVETSLMLHLRPELVVESSRTDAGPLISDNVDGMFVCRDMYQRTRDGFTGRPDLATAEKGRLLFEGIVQRLVDTARKLLSEPVGTSYRELWSDEGSA